MWDFTNNLQFLFKEVQKNAAMSSQNRSKYQGNDSHQFDEDVHCRSGSIFERIAYGVAGNSCFVSFTAFTAMNTGFDVFLALSQVPPALAIKIATKRRNAKEPPMMYHFNTAPMRADETCQNARRIILWASSRDAYKEQVFSFAFQKNSGIGGTTASSELLPAGFGHSAKTNGR